MSRPATAMKFKRVSPRPASTDGSRLPSIAVTLTLCALAVVAYVAVNSNRYRGALNEREIQQYLRDDAHPTRVVHALRQIDQRHARHEGVAQWYPELARLSASRFEDVRAEVARLMGQDASHPEFRTALHATLRDPSLLVRNAAALALAGFGDPTGHDQVIDMLQSVRVAAPISGHVDAALSAGTDVTASAVIATLRNGDTLTEVHSPVSGRVRTILVQEGDVVSAGIDLAIIDPGTDQVIAALRALQTIGYPEDVSALTPYTRPDSTAPAAVREQAAITANAIRKRNQKPTD